MSEPGNKTGATKPDPMKPRDSATLIIVDTTAGEPKVLMGKRHMNHRPVSVDARTQC